MTLDLKGWRNMAAYRFEKSNNRIISRVVTRGQDVIVQTRGGVKFIVPTYRPRV